MKLLKWLALTLIALFALLLLAGYILFYTESGLKLAVYMLKHVVPEIKISRATGKLGHAFTLEKVNYDAPNLDVHIEKISITWSLQQVFHPLLNIKNLTIQHLIIHSIPTSQQHHILPIVERLKNDARYIIIQQVYIEDFLYKQANLEKSRIKLLKLDAIANHTYALSLLLNQGHLNGQLFLNIANGYQWQFQLLGKSLNVDDLWSGFHATLNFNLTSKGQMNHDQQTMYVDVSALSGTVKGYPLQGVIRMQFENGLWLIPAFNINIAEAYLRLSGTAGKTWRLTYQLNVPNFNKIQQAISGNLSALGSVISKNNVPLIYGNLRASHIHSPWFSIESVTGNAKSSFENGILHAALNLNHLTIGKVTIPILKTQLTAKGHQDKLQISALTNISAQNRVQASVQYALQQKGIGQQGSVTFQFNNLGQLFSSSSFLTHLNGRLEGVLTIDGTLIKPRFTGTMQLKHASGKLPRLNVRLRDVNMNASINKSGEMNLTGGFRSGKGSATLTSRFNFLTPRSQFAISIKGNHLEVANLPEYHILASPDLLLSLGHHTLMLTGSVLLPEATIHAEYIHNAVVLPNEVVFVGERREQSPLSALTLHVQFKLGDKIFFNYKNLHAQLAGSVLVTQRVGGFPLGNGELIVRHGTYQIADKVFTITNGRLIFLNSILSNPELDIRAFRQWSPPRHHLFGINFALPDQIPNIKAGVSVRGTLENPQVTLISEPPLSQDDILSYLVFGKPRSQLTSADALTALTTLSAGLNLQGVTNEERQAKGTGTLFGLLTTSLSTLSQGLGFNLPLTQHLSLQTETNYDETGVDLFYIYEAN